MEIDSKYKIWKACADGDVRPILSCVHIEAANEQPEKGPRLGYAFAADGFEAVVVPVTLDVADVVPVTVHRSAFKLARGASIKGRPLVMRLRADGIELADGTLLLATKFYNNVTSYPDLAALFNEFVRPEKPRVNPHIPRPITEHGDALPFNPLLLRKVSKALGSAMLLFTQRHHDSPLLIEPLGYSFPKPPFGLVMPVSSGDEREKAKRRERWTADNLPVFNPKPEPVEQVMEAAEEAGEMVTA